MLYPLTMFCCGCSVPVGAGLVMLCHLAASVAYVVCASINLIARHPVLFSTWDAHVQLLLATFCLAGTPIIALGLWGVMQRVEVNIRLYLYYLVVCVLLDSGALMKFFLFGDVCENASAFVDVMTPSLGHAFMCGALQIASYLVVAGAIALEAYCVWVVWSLCEDVREGPGGPALADLIPLKDAVIHKLRQYPTDGPYGGIVGLSRSGVPGPYGSINMEGNSLFGGDAHEMSYPPL